MFNSEQTMQERLSNFMYGVYGLMSGGLTITAMTAYYVARIPNIEQTLLNNSLLMTLIFIGQFALVIALTALFSRLTFPMALLMFFTYAISLGITLSGVFLLFTAGSVAQTFGVAAGMFGAMTIYGYLTDTDLTRMGNVLMMLLIGLIIAMLVNLFMQSSVFNLMISAAGVVIMTLFTAYDTQKIKQLGMGLLGHDEMFAKVAVLGALMLYLDFINLFLFLLQFMGKKRD